MTIMLDDYNVGLGQAFLPEDQTDHFRSEFKARVQHSGKEATALEHSLKQLGLPYVPGCESRKGYCRSIC